MSLGATFLSRVPGDRRAALAADPGLEEALAGLVEAGQRAWSEIRIEPDAFVAFLGGSVPVATAGELGSLRAGELYLVCAYGLGAAGAAPALEAHYMRRVAAALGRIGTPAPLAADVLQELRRRLVEMQAPEQVRRGYAGRGDLGAWLSVAAVREANGRRKRGKRERSLPQAEAELLASPEADPEMAHLRGVYREAFEAAFQQALGSLTGRERNVLRYHFIEGLGIDELGALYGVHRVTAYRWVDQAREALSTRTRELLADRVSLSQGGFVRMLSLIQSRVNVRLALAQA
jgi:RNA polymerase sigma-70 factor (ECF subfamily)